jgi:16S rRNA (cytidine1402-2'-O)-methyltransferase
MFKSGTLYLVSTPIGNLEDISLRAIRILKEVDVIAAEDTRRTIILLNHFEIHTRMESYHDFNKIKKTPVLLNQLLNGKNIALVSDAGTPGISDPAYNMVIQSIRNNITIIPIPGPTAFVSALIVSGLPTDRFVFEGFLPVKKGRRSRLEQIAREFRTVVIYESPYRLLRTLSDLKDVLGDRTIAVCRELTKKFEEIQRGSLTQVIDHFSKNKIQGEFVLVIYGNKE